MKIDVKFPDSLTCFLPFQSDSSFTNGGSNGTGATAKKAALLQPAGSVIQQPKKQQANGKTEDLGEKKTSLVIAYVRMAWYEWWSLKLGF